MDNLGKLLLVAGALLLAAGGLALLLSRAGIGLGHLPGDFSWTSQSGRTRVSFPLMTMIIVSIVLTVILNVVLRLFR